ncbi:MAG: hypothetical protein ACREU3_09200 [Steroidobacteraceae bacterium]
MGQEPREIERHIREERVRLGENVAELHRRVRSSLDWRNLLRRRPAACSAAAFTGGFLLALLIGRSAARKLLPVSRNSRAPARH